MEPDLRALIRLADQAYETTDDVNYEGSTKLIEA